MVVLINANREVICSLMTQGQYGGAVLTPYAPHGEKCTPVLLTVRANCRGQTVMGKLRGCCTVMGC